MGSESSPKDASTRTDLPTTAANTKVGDVCENNDKGVSNDSDAFTIDSYAAEPSKMDDVSTRNVPYRLRSSLSMNDNQRQVNGLLLPGHVRIDGSSEDVNSGGNAQDIDSDTSDKNDPETDESQVDKLGDFEEIDNNGSSAVRYWEVEERAERVAKEICPVCGEKGHEKKNCPHLQCLACGILDEHSTRDCPLGSSCFRCGRRGHQARECPWRNASGRARGCRRCGAFSHMEMSCPTLWRVYSYNLEDEWKEASKLSALESERKRQSGSSDQVDSKVKRRNISDEHYRRDPAERWCYNCASNGNHWGDDCPLPRCNPTRTKGDPSAYSELVSSSGPYAHHLPLPPALLAPSDKSWPGLGHYEFEAGPTARMRVVDDGESERQAIHSMDELLGKHTHSRRNPPKRPSNNVASQNEKMKKEYNEDWFSDRQDSQQRSRSAVRTTGRASDVKGRHDGRTAYLARPEDASSHKAHVRAYRDDPTFWSLGKEYLPPLPSGVLRDHPLDKQDRRKIEGSVGKTEWERIIKQERGIEAQEALKRANVDVPSKGKELKVRHSMPRNGKSMSKSSNKKKKRRDRTADDGDARVKKKSKKDRGGSDADDLAELRRQRAQSPRSKKHTGKLANFNTSKDTGKRPDRDSSKRGARFFGSYNEGYD